MTSNEKLQVRAVSAVALHTRSHLGLIGCVIEGSGEGLPSRIEFLPVSD